MKKIYILALGALGFSTLAVAQNSTSLQEVNGSRFSETLPQRSMNVSSARDSETCVDTVDYALYRALNGSNQVTYATVALEDSATSVKGMGIFFPMPAGQSATINGMEFLASGIRADGMASQTIVSVYAAGADSMPTGTALVTQTVSVDTASTTFGDIYNVVSLPATVVNTPFVITVEAGSPIDSLDQFTGSGTSVGGQFDGYPTNLSIGGAWLRPGATSVLGYIVPRIHPIISYEATNSIVASVTKLTSANETVTFTTTSPSIGETVLAFTGLIATTNTSSIDFGDGTTMSDSPQAPSHTYVDETQNYTVTLTDTILLYQNSVGMCTLSETVTILKADPNGINDIENGKFFAYSAQNEIVIGNGSGEAKLYSITGKIVRQTVVTNQLETMDVSDLPTGVYILQVENNIVKLKL